MKVAVACSNNMIAHHFNQSETFLIVTFHGKEEIERKQISSPGHKPGFLPLYLAEMGVNVIIVAGIDAAAVDLFEQKGIDVITGMSGAPDEAIGRYFQGSLQGGQMRIQETLRSADYDDTPDIGL